MRNMGAAIAAVSDSAIRIDRLTRHYQMGPELIRAVEEVSLEIATGEFAALLGQSGSGKSTLLHLIAGLDRPTSGSIQVTGKELSGLSSEELARYRRHTVGMVFQAFNLIPSLRVFENVELPLRLAEMDREKRRQQVQEALEQVGLGSRSHHRPAQLSGGEQQRVAIARALVNRPSILLADEPTGNLDSRTGEQIMRLLEQCNHALNMTVVLVTHERPLAERFARRMIFMADGKVVSTPAGAGVS
jgi:putative ABC transport system ATP-binding protein